MRGDTKGAFLLLVQEVPFFHIFRSVTSVGERDSYLIRLEDLPASGPKCVVLNLGKIHKLGHGMH